MASIVLTPDMVLWATTFLRQQLLNCADPICAGAVVTDREPSGPVSSWPEKLVIVGLSDSSDRDLVISDVALRVSVLFGTPEQAFECMSLARRVHAFMRACVQLDPSAPVAAVISSRGPMWADEGAYRARRYSLFELAVQGQPESFE